MHTAQCVIVWMSPPPLLEMGHICFFRMGVVSVLFPKCWGGGGGGMLLGERGEIKTRKFRGLVALCNSFCIFIFLLQYIQSYNHSLITFAEALLQIFIYLQAQWAEPPWDADPRFELGPAFTATKRTLLFILQRWETRTLRIGSSLTTWPTPPP